MRLPDRIYIQFADNGSIRKWQREPFEEGTEFVAALPAGDVGDLVDALTEPLSMSMFIGPHDMISRLLHDRKKAASALTAMQRKWQVQLVATQNAWNERDGEKRRAEAAEAENARLKARLAEAHRVVEPFAKAADNFDDFKMADPNEWFAYGGISSANSDREGAITVGDLRRARSFSDGGSE